MMTNAPDSTINPRQLASTKEILVLLAISRTTIAPTTYLQKLRHGYSGAWISEMGI